MARAEMIKDDVLEAVYQVVCRQSEEGKIIGATAVDVKKWFIDNAPEVKSVSLETVRTSMSILESEGELKRTNPGKGPCKRYIDV